MEKQLRLHLFQAHLRVCSVTQTGASPWEPPFAFLHRLRLSMQKEKNQQR